MQLSISYHPLTFCQGLLTTFCALSSLSFCAQNQVWILINQSDDGDERRIKIDLISMTIDELIILRDMVIEEVYARLSFSFEDNRMLAISRCNGMIQEYKHS